MSIFVPRENGPVHLRTYQTLNAWRGFAALCVVFHHAAETLAAQYPRLSHSWFYYLCEAGSLGVQIFFVISGYCIASAAGRLISEKGAALTFALDRVRRIFPPYWAAITLVALVGSVASVLVHHGTLQTSTTANLNILHQPMAYYGANLFLLQPIVNRPFVITQSWTLCYELAFYLVLGLILIVASRRQNERLLLTCLHAITCISLVWLVAAPGQLNYPIDLWAEFGFGVLTYDYLRFGKNPTTIAWIAGIAFLSVLFVSLHSLPLGLLSEPSQAATLVSLGFAGLCVVLHPYDQSLTRVRVIAAFSTVGTFSYSLYLVHTVAIGVIIQFAKIKRLPVEENSLLLLTMVTAALGLGFLFYRVCEKPFIRKRASRLVTQEQPYAIVNN